MSAAVDYGYPLHHSPPAFQFSSDNPLPTYDGHASTMGMMSNQQPLNLGFLASSQPTHHQQQQQQQQDKRLSASSIQRRHFSIPLIQQPPSPAFPPQQQMASHYQTPRQSIDSLNVLPASGGNRKSRTFSSSSLSMSMTSQQQLLQQDRKRSNRRSGSTSTMGTAGTVSSIGSSSLHRSGSDSSGGYVSPYVLTLRKQKATVWCDRSQNEDARMQAAMLAAKQRADREVARASIVPPSLHSSTSSSVHRGKIRHQHARRGHSGEDYNPNLSLVAGIPARLDIGEESQDEEDTPKSPGGFSNRTGSGRSSINSNRRRYLSGQQLPLHVSTTMQQQQQQQSGGSNSNTNASSPSTYSRASSFSNSHVPVTLQDITPMQAPITEQIISAQPPPIPAKAPRSPRTEQARMSYPQHHRPSLVSQGSSYDSSSSEKSKSKKSALNGLKQSEGLHKTDSMRKREDIRRRGSVDEMKARTRTMTGVRLFVANPDQ